MNFVYAVVTALFVGAAIGYAFRGYIGKGIKQAGATATTDASKAVAEAKADATKAVSKL